MDFELQLAEDSALGKSGQRVTLSLTPADVREPSELPTYLAGYKPFDYRADEASPVVLVDNDQDKYRSFDSDDAFRRVNVKGSANGAVPEVDPKSNLRSYKVIDRYIGSFIPRVTELQTSGLYRPRMAASRRARRALELDREIDVWTLLSTQGSWDSSVQNAVTGGLEWDVQAATSDPIKDVQVAIQASAQRVDHIWLNQKCAFAFLRHPKVRDHMRQMLGDAGAQNIVGGVANAGVGGARGDFVIPGLPPFKVTSAKVKDEATGDLVYVLPDVAILVTVPPGVPEDGEEIATTYSFRRRGPSGTGFEVREFEVEGRGPLGGTMIVVSQADEAVMTGSNCGGIIENIHS